MLARGRFGPGPARVLDQVRRLGLVTREELGQASGLSPASVARAVGSLVEAGLLAERPDLQRRGVGRPTAPVQLRRDHHVAVGVHVGRRLATVSLVDLAGSIVDRRRLSPLPDDADALVAALATEVDALAAAHPERPVLDAGLVAAWGDVPHDEADLAGRLAKRLGVEVSTAHHVAAVVAAEYLVSRRTTSMCTVYVYVRDTSGFVLATDLPDRTEVGRVASLTHFPTGEDVPCGCGRSGCFAAVASDLALAQRAVERGVVPVPEVEAVVAAARAGDDRARLLLTERARVLGATTAVLRDMVAPDRVVLVGQAFSAYPPAVEALRRSFDEATTLPPMSLSFSRFGADVQAVAAGAAALGTVYQDPLASVDRAARRTAQVAAPRDRNASESSISRVLT